MAIVAGISIRNHIVSAETHALQEAQSVTKVLELLLVRHAGDREGDPLAARQAELQRNDVRARERGERARPLAEAGWGVIESRTAE